MFKWLTGKKEKTALEIVGEFAALLEKYPAAIIDVSMLPTSKTQMKQILKGLYAKEKRADFQKYLEDGFLYLSQFQEGVGAEPVNGKLLDGDIQSTLGANRAILERLVAWQKLQLAEMDILLAEWRQFRKELGATRS
jgi:hypothetical protein